MRIEELSVGDWVRHSFYEENMQIHGIEDNGRIRALASRLSASCHLDNFEPIPLTAEILTKNGLEYVEDGNEAVIFLCCDMFWARLCVGDTYWQVGIHNQDRIDAVQCNVQNLHQLQHALRLAGIRKGIVL